jgi:hypothetical protein
MTSNEIRQIIGMKPSDDPKADELRNSNLNHPEDEPPAESGNPPETSPETTADTEYSSLSDIPISALMGS